MAGNQRKNSLVAGSKSRVQNTTSDTVVKATAGILHRIVLSNTSVAAGTLTVRDSAASIQTVLEAPVSSSQSVEFGVQFDTDIRVQPSVIGIDALVVYD